MIGNVPRTSSTWLAKGLAQVPDEVIPKVMWDKLAKASQAIDLLVVVKEMRDCIAETKSLEHGHHGDCLRHRG